MSTFDLKILKNLYSQKKLKNDPYYCMEYNRTFENFWKSLSKEEKTEYNNWQQLQEKIETGTIEWI